MKFVCSGHLGRSDRLGRLDRLGRSDHSDRSDCFAHLCTWAAHLCTSLHILHMSCTSLHITTRTARAARTARTAQAARAARTTQAAQADRSGCSDRSDRVITRIFTHKIHSTPSTFTQRDTCNAFGPEVVYTVWSVI